MPVWLILVFVIAIAILSAIAIHLHWKLYRKREQIKKQDLELQNELIERQKHAAESIVIIARAYLADQVALSEASLRIQHLLKYLNLDKSDRDQLKVFDEISTRISHIPILDGWKTLDKQTKAQYWDTLEQTEKEFEDFARNAAALLLSMKLI